MKTPILIFCLAILLSSCGPDIEGLKIAAEQGDAEAQFFLGLSYAIGDDIPEDDAEAVRWYRLAAEQGHASAQEHLGMAYEHGRGVPQNNVEAVRWYRLAAEQGEILAQSGLGRAYRYGDGVPQDYREAYIWYSLAVANGLDGGATASSREEMAARLSPAELSAAQSEASRRFDVMSRSR